MTSYSFRRSVIVKTLFVCSLVVVSHSELRHRTLSGKSTQTSPLDEGRRTIRIKRLIMPANSISVSIPRGLLYCVFSFSFSSCAENALSSTSNRTCSWRRGSDQSHPWCPISAKYRQREPRDGGICGSSIIDSTRTSSFKLARQCFLYGIQAL